MAAAPLAPVPAAYEGLWRRRVIHRSSGVSDTSTRVWWCQSARFHIDLRIPAGRPEVADRAALAALADGPLNATALAAFGAQIAFAGTTVVDGDRCEWRPEIAFPCVGDDLDAGTMRFDAPDRLHEAGLDGSYTEDWERAHGGPVAGLRLAAADGRPDIAYLLAGASWLAFAHGTPTLVYAPAAPAWSEFCIAEPGADGGWTIVASNAPWREGTRLFDGAPIDVAGVAAMTAGAIVALPGHGNWRITDAA